MADVDIEYEHKFKVYRLSDFNEIEAKLNDFDLGTIEQWQLTMPDYRVIILVIRYVIEHEVKKSKPEAKNAKAAS